MEKDYNVMKARYAQSLMKSREVFYLNYKHKYDQIMLQCPLYFFRFEGEAQPKIFELESTNAKLVNQLKGIKIVVCFKFTLQQ